MAKHSSGFTLIEISIVLVIIGLVAGGVLVGRDLIAAAQLRSLIRDAESLELAVSSFRLKYDQVPGDITNATDFWPQDDLCPASSTQMLVPKEATCNGDGDGLVRDVVSGFGTHEVFRSIQHLANAGLIAGSYTGVRFSPDPGVGYIYATKSGLNIPKLRSYEAGMLLANNSDTQASHLFPGDYRLMIQIGADTDGASWNYRPFLSPLEALQVDTKADDGKPATGRWRSMIGGVDYTSPGPPPYCATTADPLTAEYNTTESQVLCSFVHILK